MANHILRLRPTGPQWPYSVAQLRADEPRLSVSSDPHPGELASYAALDPPILLFVVSQASPPAIDPRSQRLVLGVELVDNEWRQVWSVRDATEQEIASYDLVNQPPPNYLGFWDALLISQVYQTVYAIATQSLPMNTALTAFIAQFQDAKEGRPRVQAIQACIFLVMQAGAGVLTAENLAELQGLMDATNLSSLYSLQPPP
jgi:hypothetical protein